MRVVAKARWGKDPNTILTGSADGFLRVWDIRTGDKVRKVRVPGGIGGAGGVALCRFATNRAGHMGHELLRMTERFLFVVFVAFFR